MGKIVLLDELTINQIAAGEVIERPASVIKEMVENSIDAGAKNITVEIKNGGISYIRISDDGNGIAKDDIEMAFERHATSKIRSAKDLLTVRSMGFRGEALASISAIANVELISKTINDDIGTKIVVEGGKTLSIEEFGSGKGTIITVRNLFYNTPVRYKFLKKDFTESGYIEDVIKRIALIHPEIAIKLINTGKTILQTNGNGDLKSTIYTTFGKEIANQVIPVSYEYQGIKINGVVGKPIIARSNRANQIFYINKRYVKDKTLTSSVDKAYKESLPIGKFGFVILNLDMDLSKVDVNVHPAKLEVRFENENDVFKAVFHAIKNGLFGEEINDKELKSDNSENTIYVEKNEENIFNKNYEENKVEINKNIDKNIIEANENKIDNKNSLEDLEIINKEAREKTAEEMLNKLIKLRNDLKEQVNKREETDNSFEKFKHNSYTILKDNNNEENDFKIEELIEKNEINKNEEDFIENDYKLEKIIEQNENKDEVDKDEEELEENNNKIERRKKI